VFGPGHLGELTQTIDFALVDAVLEETRTQERRLRLLPSRVVVYFVLALALFERCSYQAVWGKLTAGLGGLSLARPAASSLCRARRRIGAEPLRRLFETLAGPVGPPGQAGVFYRGLRTVAVDGTHLHVPDDPAITWRYPKRAGERLEFGYPLLRLLALIECGTRAVLAAAFGPDTAGELACAGTLLNALDATMLLLADAGFDAAEFLRDIGLTGAQFLIRSTARRCPTPLAHLPDGSYLARLGYGVLPALIPVRVIEAAVTITLADGTTRTEQWRLVTSLPGHARHPAGELVALYHERWQAETTYYSIKATMLDGRVLRSHNPPDRHRPGGLRPARHLPSAHPRRRRHRRHPARPGHGPDQLHHLAADRRRPGHHRQQHPPRRASRPGRRDRPGRPARPAARLAAAPHQSTHPQEPHQQIRPQRRAASRNRPDLHLPRTHRFLRRRAYTPRTTLNATALDLACHPGGAACP
jgi:hypothetical protein